MTILRQITINHNGLNIDVDVTYFVPSRPAPMAQTPDCPGYDDEGAPGEVEFDITGVEVDCPGSFIESGGIIFDCDEELSDKVFKEMEQ